MKKWTKIEEDYLRNNPSQTNKEIGIILKRSEDAIGRKRGRLGLKPSKSQTKPLSIEEEVDMVKFKREESTKSKQVRHLLDRLEVVEKERDALLSVDGRIKTHAIKASVSDKEKSNATTISLASDWHIEEPVKSSQVNGLNSFNLDIAKERAEKLFKVTAKLIEVHQREYKIENHILALLGDFISGSIHEDLMESNTIQPTEAIWEAQNLIASGIQYLLDNTNVNLIIPCSSGNHGRITAKQRVSTDYGNSLEILMYRNLEKYFDKEKKS